VAGGLTVCDLRTIDVLGDYWMSWDAPTVDVVPITRPTVVLTDRGYAARALYRFIRAVRDLDAADWSVILALLKLELTESLATV